MAFGADHSRSINGLESRISDVVIVVLAQEFFGVVVGVGCGLAVVQMWWWDPFGVAVVVFAGGPVLFGQWVMTAAGQGEVVDVGGVAVGVGVGVVDFAVIAGHLAVGEGAAAVFGVQHDSLGWGGQAF